MHMRIIGYVFSIGSFALFALVSIGVIVFLITNPQMNILFFEEIDLLQILITITFTGLLSMVFISGIFSFTGKQKIIYVEKVAQVEKNSEEITTEIDSSLDEVLKTLIDDLFKYKSSNPGSFQDVDKCFNLVCDKLQAGQGILYESILY